MLKLTAVVSILLCCAAGSSLPVPAQTTDQEKALEQMKIREHLLAVRVKLTEQRKRLASKNQAPELKGLQEALGLLDRAVGFYRFYLTGDSRLLSPSTPGALNSSGSRSGPQVAADPFSYRTHLELALKQLDQLRTQLMIQDRRYSHEEVARVDALDSVAASLKKIPEVIETSRGWSIKEGSGYPISVSLPKSFEPNHRTPGRPIDYVQKAADGSVCKMVYVSVDRQSGNQDLAAYRMHLIEELRPRFENFRLVESGSRDRAIPAHRFEVRYRYQWEGKRVEALIHAVADSGKVYLLHCVGLSDRFNEGECREIAKTFSYR